MEAITGSIILKPGREKSVLNRHPWIFSGAVARVEGAPQPGDLVMVSDQHGRFLATGYYNSRSQIRVRILSWDPTQPIDDGFWRRRLQRAVDGRASLANNPDTNAYRLVNAEADALPGLIVDYYAGHLVLQSLTAGIEKRKDRLTHLLAELLRPESIFERSDTAVRRKESLEPQSGLLYGAEPPAPLVITENGHRFQVDLRGGHKTGFYLDQRENRALFGRESLLGGRTLLNVFAYSGGFAVYAASAGAAHITNIDSSIPALELAESNVLLNAPQRTGDEYVAGDAFEILRFFRDEEARFDAVVLDPPKFAHSQGDIRRASRGYKDLNMLALELLNPGGILATFSCSGHISADLFQKILFGAALDAGREVQLLQPLAQGADHPVALNFPESAYLKGLLCRAW